MGGQSAHRQLDALDCTGSESLMGRKDRTPALMYTQETKAENWGAFSV